MKLKFRKIVVAAMKAAGNSEGNVEENALPIAVQCINNYALENAVRGKLVPEQTIPFSEYVRKLYIDCNLCDLWQNVAGQWLDSDGKLVITTGEPYSRLFLIAQLKRNFPQIRFSETYIEDLYSLFLEILAFTEKVPEDLHVYAVSDFGVKFVIKFINDVYSGKYKIGRKIPKRLFYIYGVSAFGDRIWNRYGNLQTLDLESLAYKLLILMTLRFYDEDFEDVFAQAILYRLKNG